MDNTAELVQLTLHQKCADMSEAVYANGVHMGNCAWRKQLTITLQQRSPCILSLMAPFRLYVQIPALFAGQYKLTVTEKTGFTNGKIRRSFVLQDESGRETPLYGAAWTQLRELFAARNILSDEENALILGESFARMWLRALYDTPAEYVDGAQCYGFLQGVHGVEQALLTLGAPACSRALTQAKAAMSAYTDASQRLNAARQAFIQSMQEQNVTPYSELGRAEALVLWRHPEWIPSVPQI